MRHRCILFVLIVLGLQQQVDAAPTAALATDESTGCELSYVSDESVEPREYYIPAASPVAVPPPLDLSRQLALDDESYKDVYKILKEENDCSQFFGGPLQAVEAFNQFASQLKRKPLESRNVAVRMRGTFRLYHNHQTGADYRIFSEATVNSNGPLSPGFHAVVGNRGNVHRTRVGRFLSTTRGARALIYLHELGHLVMRDDGEWVLPNDGADFDLSERNTKTVEEACARQLAGIK